MCEWCGLKYNEERLLRVRGFSIETLAFFVRVRFSGAVPQTSYEISILIRKSLIGMDKIAVTSIISAFQDYRVVGTPTKDVDVSNGHY